MTQEILHPEPREKVGLDPVALSRSPAAPHGWIRCRVPLPTALSANRNPQATARPCSAVPPRQPDSPPLRLQAPGGDSPPLRLHRCRRPAPSTQARRAVPAGRRRVLIPSPRLQSRGARLHQRPRPAAHAAAQQEGAASPALRQEQDNQLLAPHLSLHRASCHHAMVLAPLAQPSVVAMYVLHPLLPTFGY